MSQIKYLRFENIADLEEKLEKLREIRDRNLQETEEFLIITGIPFTRLAEGFGVNLQDVDQVKLEEYFNKFDKQGRSTRELYEAHGVVYLTEPDHVDHRISLEMRKN